MRGRVTITKRHTGRYYVGMDAGLFNLLKWRVLAWPLVYKNQIPGGDWERIYKAFESFEASNSQTTDRSK